VEYTLSTQIHQWHGWPSFGAFRKSLVWLLAQRLAATLMSVCSAPHYLQLTIISFFCILSNSLLSHSHWMLYRW